MLYIEYLKLVQNIASRLGEQTTLLPFNTTFT